MLKNRKAVISGATAGIGKATATALAKNEVDLLLLGRRVEKLETLKKQLQSEYKVQVEIAKCDISKRSEVQTLTQDHSTFLKNTSILVNNAGLAIGKETIDKSNPKDWDQMIDTNIKGLLYLTHELLPHLKSQKLSDIINIGSVAGRWTYPGGNIYSATKFAVRALSESMRHDLIGSSIRVSNIEPGMVETEFSEVRFKDKEKAREIYKDMNPLVAKDIAETILWVLKRPEHVNIQELVIFPKDQASVGEVYRTPTS